MAAVIKAKFNIEPKLIRGDQGIFDIAVNNKTVFSKFDIGRFPEDSEVVEAIAKVLKP